MDRYIFAKNIDGFKDNEGVIDTKTTLLLCLCNEENAKLIISGLKLIK